MDERIPTNRPCHPNTLGFAAGCLHCVENASFPRELTQVEITHNTSKFSAPYALEPHLHSTEFRRLHTVSSFSQYPAFDKRTCFAQGECSTCSSLSTISNLKRRSLASCLEEPNRNILNVKPHATADRFGSFLSKKASMAGYMEENVKTAHYKIKDKHPPLGGAEKNLNNVGVSLEKGVIIDNTTLPDVLLAIKNGTTKNKRLQTKYSTETPSNTIGGELVQGSSFPAPRHTPSRKKPINRITSYNDIRHCSINIDKAAGPWLIDHLGDFDEEASAIRGFHDIEDDFLGDDDYSCHSHDFNGRYDKNLEEVPTEYVSLRKPTGKCTKCHAVM